MADLTAAEVKALAHVDSTSDPEALLSIARNAVGKSEAVKQGSGLDWAVDDVDLRFGAVDVASSRLCKDNMDSIAVDERGLMRLLSTRRCSCGRGKSSMRAAGIFPTRTYWTRSEPCSPATASFPG